MSASCNVYARDMGLGCLNFNRANWSKEYSEDPGNDGEREDRNASGKIRSRLLQLVISTTLISVLLAMVKTLFTNRPWTLI